jgi:hypothetical protein
VIAKQDFREVLGSSADGEYRLERVPAGKYILRRNARRPSPLIQVRWKNRFPPTTPRGCYQMNDGTGWHDTTVEFVRSAGSLSPSFLPLPRMRSPHRSRLIEQTIFFSTLRVLAPTGAILVGFDFPIGIPKRLRPRSKRRRRNGSSARLVRRRSSQPLRKCGLQSGPQQRNSPRSSGG